MADMMKVKDAAALWGLTPRRVSELCKQGKVANARKVGKAWMIPVGTPKPADQRIRSGVYAKTFLPEVPIVVDASCCAGVTPESHKNALEAMKCCQVKVENA